MSLLVPATLPLDIRLKVLPAFPFEVFRIFRVIDQRSIGLLRGTPNPEKIFEIDSAPRGLLTTGDLAGGGVFEQPR